MAGRKELTARELKGRLYSRHLGHGGQMPGPWTVIEEWRGIDLLAFSAWQSAGRYARVGYEVKISRTDLRRELLAPYKRKLNVDWCNEFYFALPRGLLTDDELAYVEPQWGPRDFVREECPNRLAMQLLGIYAKRKFRCIERVPIPRVIGERENYEFRPSAFSKSWEEIACRTCGGKGEIAKSRVEQEAPTCWIPRDVGLVLVDGRGTQVVKSSPKRKIVPTLGPGELGQLARWISMRPDPRHHPRTADAGTL